VRNTATFVPGGNEAVPFRILTLGRRCAAGGFRTISEYQTSQVTVYYDDIAVDTKPIACQ
jgi:hypothetical protein